MRLMAEDGTMCLYYADICIEFMHLGFMTYVYRVYGLISLGPMGLCNVCIMGGCLRHVVICCLYYVCIVGRSPNAV